MWKLIAFILLAFCSCRAQVLKLKKQQSSYSHTISKRGIAEDDFGHMRSRRREIFIRRAWLAQKLQKLGWKPDKSSNDDLSSVDPIAKASIDESDSASLNEKYQRKSKTNEDTIVQPSTLPATKSLSVTESYNNKRKKNKKQNSHKKRVDHKDQRRKLRKKIKALIKKLKNTLKQIKKSSRSDVEQLLKLVDKKSKQNNSNCVCNKMAYRNKQKGGSRF